MSVLRLLVVVVTGVALLLAGASVAHAGQPPLFTPGWYYGDAYDDTSSGWVMFEVQPNGADITGFLAGARVDMGPCGAHPPISSPTEFADERYGWQLFFGRDAYHFHIQGEWDPGSQHFDMDMSWTDDNFLHRSD